MSENNCDCYWCKKGISKEEAKVRRLEFITKVFELMFIYFFKKVEKDVEKVTGQFKDVLNEFFNDKSMTGEDVDKKVIDIIFYEIGLGTEIKPFEIFMYCYKIHNAIDNAFSAFRQDIRMEETPILSGILTPENFVANETGETKLPDSIIDLYRKSNKNSLEGMLESITPEIEKILQGSETKHTVH